METKNIKQTASFDVTPEEVYELIMDAKKHAAFTGADAKMSKKVKGTFEVYGGYCKGHNIELEPGKKLFRHGTLRKTAGRRLIFRPVLLFLKKKEKERS